MRNMITDVESGWPCPPPSTPNMFTVKNLFRRRSVSSDYRWVWNKTTSTLLRETNAFVANYSTSPLLKKVPKCLLVFLSLSPSAKELWEYSGPPAHLWMISESGRMIQCGCRRKPETASRQWGRGDPEPWNDWSKVKQSGVKAGSNPGFLKGNPVLFYRVTSAGHREFDTAEGT